MPGALTTAHARYAACLTPAPGFRPCFPCMACRTCQVRCGSVCAFAQQQPAHLSDHPRHEPAPRHHAAGKGRGPVCFLSGCALQGPCRRCIGGVPWCCAWPDQPPRRRLRHPQPVCGWPLQVGGKGKDRQDQLVCDAAFGPSVVMGWMSALSQNWSYLLALQPGAGWWRLPPCRQRCRAAHAAPPSCQAALCAQVARSVVPNVLPSGLAASSNTSSSPEPGPACLPPTNALPCLQTLRSQRRCWSSSQTCCSGRRSRASWGWACSEHKPAPLHALGTPWRGLALLLARLGFLLTTKSMQVGVGGAAHTSPKRLQGASGRGLRAHRVQAGARGSSGTAHGRAPPAHRSHGPIERKGSTAQISAGDRWSVPTACRVAAPGPCHSSRMLDRPDHWMLSTLQSAGSTSRQAAPLCMPQHASTLSALGASRPP